MTHLRRLLGNDSGATAIEYSLIAALIAVAMVAAVNSFHGKLGSTYTFIANAIGGVL